MVVNTMSKSVVKVSVSDSESSGSSADDSSDNEETMELKVAKVIASSDNNNIESDQNAAESDSNEENEGKNSLATNEGWADSLAKILSSNKPKNKKTLVLSRAKKYTEIVKCEEKKPQFEVIGEGKQEETPNLMSTEPAAKKKKIEKTSIRVKPKILERDRERLLSKIATKGVVQLFNAVRNQQKTIEKETDRNDITETKKEKILQKFDKRTFLDTLMGKTKSIVVDDQAKVTELKDEGKPKWDAFKDDYMMSAKMKDWDRAEEE